MSFRLKTVLGIALIEAALLLVLIVVSLNYLRVSNEQQFLTRAETTAQLFATTAKDAVLVTDVALLDTLVEEVLTNPGVVYARVLGAGRVLAEGGDPRALAQARAANRSVRDADDGVYDVHAELAADGETYGRVELGLTVAPIQAVLRDARNHALSIAGVEMVLVAFFSLVLGTYLTRQLGALRSASQRVAEGDFTSRIPVQGRDELAQTASAFNAMAARLQEAGEQRARAEEALRALNEQLEERVRARTEELAELNRQLHHRALHDGLTGLPNRSLFHDRLHTQLAAAERNESRFAVALLDLNRFKQINDAEGHAVGDRVLQAIARRLSAVLRDGDTVARLGGDEFALILPAVVDAEGARTAGSRLLAALSAPLHVAERDLLPGGSVGMALYPDHGHEPELLLRHADTAMYQAKFAGTGFALYRPLPAPVDDDEAQA
ncbi:diguanylate cyclase [Ectothiorhodospiraceae bacterium 2226]|nr:diguanylate cyclase [Ectothiorhodospiraceae bacterium 2226]